MHRTVLIVVVVLVTAGLALAQPAAPGPGMGGGMGMGMGGGQGSMMGTGADLAASGGNVYLLEGMTLKKLGPDLKQVKAIELPDMTADMEKMMDAGICPMCGGMHGAQGGGGGGGMGGGMMGGRPAPAAGAAPAEPGGDGMMPMMMCRHRMMSMVKLTADASGVYLLRLGHLYKYDLDLNLQQDAQVIGAGEMKPSPQMMQMMQKMQEGMQKRGMSCPMMSGQGGGMGMGGGMGQHMGQVGPMSKSESEEIPEGMIAVAHHPSPL